MKEKGGKKNNFLLQCSLHTNSCQHAFSCTQESIRCSRDSIARCFKMSVISEYMSCLIISCKSNGIVFKIWLYFLISAMDLIFLFLFFTELLMLSKVFILLSIKWATAHNYLSTTRQ